MVYKEKLCKHMKFDTMTKFNEFIDNLTIEITKEGIHLTPYSITINEDGTVETKNLGYILPWR